MLRRLSISVMILWGAYASAAIQSSDFWFHEDGETVFIDGSRGAPLHIDYIGQALTKPLTIKITPSNPGLRVIPKTCAFSKKNHVCRLIIRDAKPKESVYGVNHFDVTEVGLLQGPLKAQATVDTGSVGFGVGVQQQNMPNPIGWAGSNTMQIQKGKVIVVNGTRGNEAPVNYKVTSIYMNESLMKNGYINSKEFSLPNGASCYIDAKLFNDPRPKYEYFFKGSAGGFPNNLSVNSLVQDISNPSAPIFNGFYGTGNNNISTCSAQGQDGCASNQWASWNIGLANLGSTDMDGGVKAGQIETLRDNAWNNGSYIYYSKSWSSSNLALLLIQGSRNGSGFDVNTATPNILQIQSASPCSYYLKPDQTVTYSVQVQAFGPGTITMPAGGQCNKYSTPGLDFTYCTGGGYKDALYEMTAVPDTGKTFKGWTGGNGECDAAGATCRFNLTSDVQFKANFQ